VFLWPQWNQGVQENAVIGLRGLTSKTPSISVFESDGIEHFFFLSNHHVLWETELNCLSFSRRETEHCISNIG